MNRIILILAFLTTWITEAQSVYTHNSKVRVKNTDTSLSTDNLITIDANGKLNRSTVTLSEVGTASNLQDVLTGGNTADIGISLVGTGKGFEYLIQDTSGNEKSQLSAGILLLTGAGFDTNEVKDLGLLFTDDSTGFTLDLVRDTDLIANTTVLLPNKSTGTYTLATTSDIPPYDEGTFTPTLIAQGGGATYSITIDYATYTRVGNSVSFNIRLTGVNTTGTPVGSLRLDNLPLTAINNTMSASVGFFGGDVNFYSIRGIISSTSIYFNYQDSLDSSNLQTIQACTITGGILEITGTYKTNVYTP